MSGARGGQSDAFPVGDHRLDHASRPSASCSVEDGCITCGDVAVPLTVVEAGGTDVRCRDEAGSEEVVAVDLVGEVAPGERLLVHAGVALERLSEGSG